MRACAGENIVSQLNWWIEVCPCVATILLSILCEQSVLKFLLSSHPNHYGNLFAVSKGYLSPTWRLARAFNGPDTSLDGGDAKKSGPILYFL